MRCSRREALALLGAAGYSVLAGVDPARGQPSAGCVVRPEQTEGPFFVEEALDRSDLRSDPSDGTVKPGVPLELILLVSRLEGGRCAPLPGARVDVWHSDHQGTYSDVGGTRGKKFLRGYQTTDGEGRVKFVTVFPGAYSGRAVHIHFKVRAPQARGRMLDYTSQLYFDDALIDRVVAAPPYVGAGRRIRNASDGLYQRGGRALTVALSPQGAGYAGSFGLALDVS